MTANSVPRLRLGLVVNPVAGLGGSVGLKGSDGDDLQAAARELGGTPRGHARTTAFLEALAQCTPPQAGVAWIAAPGALGNNCLQDATHVTALALEVPAETTGAHTREAVKALVAIGVDCLVFTGGDGTARDVLAALADVAPHQLVLGIPAGVKMHSGVFAVSPTSAAQVIAGLLTGRWVNSVEQDVRDFVAGGDPGEIRTRSYGTLRVPEAGGYLQHTKEAGRESEPLALEEIVADVVENLDRNQPVVLGPGSTVYAIKEALALQGTLRGFDILSNGAVQRDVPATAIAEVADRARLIISFTRRQGFLLGRGNQQLTPAVLRTFDWPRRVTIVATRSKLKSLDGRPLLVDTGEAALDERLAGLVTIVSGYEDRLLYRVATQAHHT